MTKKFENAYILNHASIVGKKEFDGPLGKYFDSHIMDYYLEESSTLKAEAKLLQMSIKMALNKSNLKNVDLIISGDLENQIESSSIACKDLGIPFLGIYNACSSYIAGIIIASHFIDSNSYNNIIVSTSSHNMTAERQFRNPNEYGANKPLTTTSTVTIGASLIVSSIKSKYKIINGTFGKIVDSNQKNPSDMGSVMAPACYEVIIKNFKDLNINSDYYDLIVTGDLGKNGSKILNDLLLKNNINIMNKHFDCGVLIYDLGDDFIQGGSGCGCIAGVFNSYILKMMEEKNLKRALIVGTGALLNDITFKQGLTIPGIAHAIGVEII